MNFTDDSDQNLLFAEKADVVFDRVRFLRATTITTENLVRRS